MSRFVPTNGNIRISVKSYIEGNTNNLPPIGDWDTSNITNMSGLFSNSSFNEDISRWDVSKVTNMRGMFRENRIFNQPLNTWNVSKVTDMSKMFKNAFKFNQRLYKWDVSKVTNMREMFQDAHKFNEYIDRWNVSNVTNMSNMFESAFEYNQALNRWNVSNVTDMSEMFYKARDFNNDLSNWNVSNVTNMRNMFYSAAMFNKSITFWNVSNVTDMKSMFEGATRFNQPLDRWNVTHVRDMSRMFKDTVMFGQNISRWRFHPNTNTEEMFYNAGRMIEEYKPLQLQPVPQPVPQPVQNGVAFQVHDEFDRINLNELVKLLNGTVLQYRGQNFNQYIETELTSLLNNYNEPDKADLQTKFNSLLPKIRDISYGVKNIYYTVIDFVKKQDKHYQDNYISFFINDCFNAYDKGDTTSCAKGIKERLVFSLASAGHDIDNPKYKQMAEIIYPISNKQLLTFVGNCIQQNTAALDELGENLDEKKALIKQCVIKQIQESSSNTSIASLDDRINKLINDSHDMLGGKKSKRKTTRKRKSQRKENRIYKRKYTRKGKKTIKRRK